MRNGGAQRGYARSCMLDDGMYSPWEGRLEQLLHLLAKETEDVQ